MEEALTTNCILVGEWLHTESSVVSVPVLSASLADRASLSLQPIGSPGVTRWPKVLPSRGRFSKEVDRLEEVTARDGHTPLDCERPVGPGRAAATSHQFDGGSSTPIIGPSAPRRGKHLFCLPHHCFGSISCMCAVPNCGPRARRRLLAVRCNRIQSLASVWIVNEVLSLDVRPVNNIVVVSNGNECLYSSLSGGLCLKINAASAWCRVASSETSAAE